jgi:hypothetical protein
MFARRKREADPVTLYHALCRSVGIPLGPKPVNVFYALPEPLQSRLWAAAGERASVRRGTE